MSRLYIDADLDSCRARRHKFNVTWSDKNQARMNLMCRTCTEANPGKSAYVAWGKETEHLSFGQWAERKRELKIESERSEGE